jgi:protein-tyrosine phosphatase
MLSEEDAVTTPDDKVRLCFVCLGNICRSPTAQGVMVHVAAREGVADRLHVESAGTGSWHVGEPPDRRAVLHARRRGIALRSRAQQWQADWFSRFDLVLAADLSNRASLLRLAPDAEARAKVRLLREFDPEGGALAEVPDPYYGGDAGFEEVLDICERACAGLLAHLRAEGRI